LVIETNANKKQMALKRPFVKVVGNKLEKDRK